MNFVILTCFFWFGETTKPQKTPQNYAKFIVFYSILLIFFWLFLVFCVLGYQILMYWDAWLAGWLAGWSCLAVRLAPELWVTGCLTSGSGCLLHRAI